MLYELIIEKKNVILLLMVLGKDNFQKSEASTSTTKSNNKIIYDKNEKSTEGYLLRLFLLLSLIYIINL